MQHPYLFFSGADIERFRRKIGTDAAAKERYEKAVGKAEELLAEPFVTWEDANGSETQHANFGALNRQANRLCDCLGLKYAVEGDERCAERLKALTAHFITFDRWYAHSYFVRKPNPWHSDLCSTATTLALGRIFDIIRGYLTDDERLTLARGIFEKGVLPALGDWALPETRIHALDSMGHNWWAVCNAEAATALLALRDDLPGTDCDGMLDCVDHALADYLTYPGNRLFNKTRSFDDKGFFYEGVGYDNYGTGTLLQYLFCRERYDGRNETIRATLPAGFADAPIYFMYPITREGKTAYLSLNFCDSDTDNFPERIVRYAARLGLDTSPSRALAATCGTGLWEEIAGVDYASLKGSVEALPKTAVLSSGYAVTRDTWEPDGTVFAVHSGMCWNHAHNDAGSFVIFHRGRPFFTDCGTCDYSKPEYHAYYCQDAAHSLLLVDGRSSRDEELYRGNKFPGALIDTYKGKDFFFVQADATGPAARLCSRLYRNFIWIDDRLLVIVDDVYCHEPRTVQFSLHYDGTYRQEGNTVWFDNDGMTAKLISHGPAAALTEKVGHESHKQDEDKIYIELSDGAKERTHTLLHTLELDPEDRNVTYETLSCEHGDGVKITDGDVEREIWYNHLADGHVMHDNSQTTVGGYDTDAYLLMITRDSREQTERVLAVCASFLRRDGKVYHSSYAKKTVEVVTGV
ncbi:MAG: heparinase II/III-family protein [Clostridia bacterium]|nr:heparinase II/III-family protein [Clostridia bacterium]